MVKTVPDATSSGGNRKSKRRHTFQRRNINKRTSVCRVAKLLIIDVCGRARRLDQTSKQCRQSEKAFARTLVSRIEFC